MTQEVTGPILSTLLTRDVEAAQDRATKTNLPSDRRDFVRAVFSGIEGLLWFLKVQVTGGHGHGVLRPEELDALFERGYTVTERGEIREAPRFLPITTSTKLLVKTIQRFDATYKVDFQNVGWQCLCEAIEVRNRIVHPKCVEDLSVTGEDLKSCAAGFNWILSLVVEGQRVTIQFLEKQAEELRRHGQGLTRNESANKTIEPTSDTHSRSDK